MAIVLSSVFYCSLILSSSTESSTKTLRLLSKAVILNDTENMQVENLSCIVGFPNVSQFASIVDPMISDEDVRVFLDHLAQCEADYGRSMHSHPSSIMSNSVMTQQIMSPSAFSSAPPNHDHIAQDSKTEDLHLYEFKNVLLTKKERLMLPIFDIDIPYKDVYNCKIETPQSGYVHAGYDERKPSEEVRSILTAVCVPRSFHLENFCEHLSRFGTVLNSRTSPISCGQQHRWSSPKDSKNNNSLVKIK